MVLVLDVDEAGAPISEEVGVLAEVAPGVDTRAIANLDGDEFALVERGGGGAPIPAADANHAEAAEML